MKRKSPRTSDSASNRQLDSAENERIDDDPSMAQSSKDAVDNGAGLCLNQKKKRQKTSIWKQITREQFITTANDLGIDRKQLDNETWRLNNVTRSNDSVWSRLISSLNLSQTENVRHSLYVFWRRHRRKLEIDRSECAMYSNEEDSRSGNENEDRNPPLSGKIQPLPSNPTLPYPGTRFADQQQESRPVFIERSFILNSKEWRAIFDISKREMKSDWTTAIYNKVHEEQFRCILIFKYHHLSLENSRKRNACFFRSVAVCSTPSCERTFVILIRDEPVGKESIVARVRAMGEENHSEDEKPAMRQLTGTERMVAGKMANEIGCLKLFQQKVENADEEMLKAGNFTGCETAEVIKHAAADQRKKHRVDEDIFGECRVRQQLIEAFDVTSVKIKGYVQVSGEKPFRLHLTSEAQLLRFITYCTKTMYSHLYIDATGSIVKSLPHQKIVLLYAAVFKDGSDPTNVIPLSHAILADHTATSIAYFLGNIRQHIVTLVDKVVRPSFFVTDFSPAIFNAILLTFNHEDIHGHLKRCWNVLLRKYDVKQLRSRSFVRICCSHMMNAFSRSLAAASVEKKIRKKVMHIFALFINCGELEMSFKFLKRVLHLFGNPHATDAEHILDAFLEAPYDSDESSEKIGSCDFEAADDSTDPLDEVDETVSASKAIIHESPFNVEAVRRFPQLSELLNSKTKYDNVTNSLFSRRIVYVFCKWFAYLPMWTSLLTEFEDRYASDRAAVDLRKYGHGRLSNAQVESYFSILKECILERKTNLRPAEVVVSLYRSVQIQLKADKFGVCQVAKNRKGKARDMNVEETWGKKKAQKKQRSVYFSRLDKCDVKRLGAKSNAPKMKSSHRKPKSISPSLVALSPKLASVSPKPRSTDAESPPRVLDNFSFVPNNLQTQASEIFNNLPSATFSHHSPEVAASKPVESFCGRSIVDEQDACNNQAVTLLSSQSTSQCNIFSSLTMAESFDIPVGVKHKKMRGSQEKNSNINGDAVSDDVGRRLLTQENAESLPSPLAHSFDRMTVIGQCSLPWPSFGIKRKCFNGRVYSVTNTCSVDATLFPLYVLFRTESNVRDIVLNATTEPFLSLRNTFSLIEMRGWDEARLYWLTARKLLPSQTSNSYNIYGTVDANVLNFIKNPIQLYRTKKSCTRRNCIGSQRILTHSDVSLESWENTVLIFSSATTCVCSEVAGSLQEISYKNAHQRGYKQHRRRITNIETNTREEEDVWLCNAEVNIERSQFIHGPPPFLFVGIVHPTMDDPNSEGVVQVKRTFHDLQHNITVGSSAYVLRAAINHQDNHFTTTIVDPFGRVYIYDDLKGVNEEYFSPFCVETAVYLLKK